MVRPELNSRPPAWQPDTQPTELPVRCGVANTERGKMFAIISLAVLLKGEENKLESWTDTNIQNVTDLHTKSIIVYGHELQIEQ